MKLSLALPREALSIPVIRHVLGDALRGLGVSDDCVDDILVAASEACTNVVQHTRSDGDFEVTGEVSDDTCVLKISNAAPGPHKAPGTPAGAGDLAESGRGIRIMRALVDDLAIDPVSDSGTVVHLTKRLTWREEALIRRLERQLMHSAG